MENTKGRKLSSLINLNSEEPTEFSKEIAKKHYRLGKAYRQGVGNEVDLIQAFEHFNLAATLGF